MSIAAAASGDNRLRRDCQRNIDALNRRYDQITEAAGLSPQREQMRVAGFRAAKVLKGPAKDGIIQVGGQAVNSKMRWKKQRQHIKGTAEYERRVEQARKDNKPLPSAFNADVDVEALVRAHMGTGISNKKKGGSLSEYFSADRPIGQVYLPASGKYVETMRVCIRYSNGGWHAFPVIDNEKG